MSIVARVLFLVLSFLIDIMLVLCFIRAELWGTHIIHKMEVTFFLVLKAIFYYKYLPIFRVNCITCRYVIFLSNCLHDQQSYKYVWRRWAVQGHRATCRTWRFVQKLLGGPSEKGTYCYFNCPRVLENICRLQWSFFFDQLQFWSRAKLQPVWLLKF